MNKTLATILTVLAVLILAVAVFFAGNMYARVTTFGTGSMMPAYGWNNNTYHPFGTGTTMGMNGRNHNMMGGNNGMMGNGGVSSNYAYNNANVSPLTIAQAKDAAGKYLANLNNSDLQIAEVMIFDNNAYVVVKEAGTGIGAFELLVDPVSQLAYPEHGPNMMWNLKYNGLNHQYMMSGRGFGMMGGYSATPADVSATMTVTPEQAIDYAQKYLDANISGATAAADPIQFYGYYTLDFEKDGKPAGMLSVNGFSGQVFLHTWHGVFIEESN